MMMNPKGALQRDWDGGATVGHGTTRDHFAQGFAFTRIQD